MEYQHDRRPRRTSMADPRVVEFLAKTALFRDCDPKVTQQVAAHVAYVDYGPGDQLVDAGSARPQIGFLARGAATVSAVDPRTGQSSELYILAPGDSFGEAGALLGKPQPLRILATEACRVIRISQEALDQLVAKVPAFSVALARRVASRLLQATETSVAASTPAPALPSLGASAEIRFVSVSDYPQIEGVLDLVPRQLINRRRLLPLQITGSTLTVGMVDPRDGGAIRELTRVLESAAPEIVAIAADDFISAVRRLRLDQQALLTRDGRVPPESVVFDEVETERESAQSLRSVGDQVVRLAAQLVAAGLARHASDIHIETERSAMRVRFRVNGMLSDWEEAVPAYVGKALIARFKVLAGVDITERRRPQDGRIGVRIGDRDVDLRVSTLPSSEGEKLVMRVFEAAQMLQGVDQIFFERRTLTAVRAALERPYGAIVVAGPTGSGKSSTLYAALHERRRARPDTNILTVEDPVEYRLSGVTQVQVNHAIDLGFAKVLRAMLRQDPDVVMVGEVRDPDTAQLALEAAMTGHLMLTSMHANNAAAVIQRLENLGCNRSVIAQSVALVLVQRLARRLCPSCTSTGAPPPILLDALVSRHLYDPKKPSEIPRARGCAACDNTGLAGRVAVVESLVLDDELRSMLMTEQSLSDIVDAAAKRRSLLWFYQYARHLMQQSIIGPAEALLTVAG